MKTLISFLLALYSLPPLHAQQYGMEWIGATVPTADTQLWYVRTIATSRPWKTARLEIATTGHYCLYVNQYNIDRSVLMPHRKEHERHLPARQDIDITPYLRPDTNTIAVWYAPQNAHTKANEPQIAAWVYGTDIDGTPFSYPTDNDWTWSFANAGTDWTDATTYRPDWNQAAHPIMGWQPAMPTASPTLPMASSPCRTPHIVNELRPSWQSAKADSLVAGFPGTFHGWIRVTIRGAHPGERITINKMTYTCDGTMDEQACHRFSTESVNRVVVRGDRWFQPSQIQSIEGLEIKETKEEWNKIGSPLF